MSSRMKRGVVAAVVGLAGAGFAAGCATMNVSSFTERGVNFRQYRTYSWAPPDTSQESGTPRPTVAFRAASASALICVTTSFTRFSASA